MLKDGVDVRLKEVISEVCNECSAEVLGGCATATRARGKEGLCKVSAGKLYVARPRARIPLARTPSEPPGFSHGVVQCSGDLGDETIPRQFPDTARRISFSLQFFIFHGAILLAFEPCEHLKGGLQDRIVHGHDRTSDHHT